MLFFRREKMNKVNIEDINQAFRLLSDKDKSEIKKLITEKGYGTEDGIKLLPSTLVECGIAKKFTFNLKVFKQLAEHWQ